VLAGQPLSFAAKRYPVPLAVWAESGGPGDDLRVECQNGVVVEVQAKRGLSAGKKFWEAVMKLVAGLADDPNLLGVLLVDSTASHTVRTNFRQGVQRLAEGRPDAPNQVTRTFLGKLDDAGVTDFSVLKRLAVEVRDFDEGSSGHEHALWMLREVAKDPPTAWRALDAEAHSSIESRGRRTAEDLTLLLSAQGGGISTRASQPAALAHAYRNWLTDVTSGFRVPGASVVLPIGNAWARLDAWDDEETGMPAEGRALEDRIRSYREWARLGMRERWASAKRGFDADRLSLAGDRLVVVAGPGAGKSTLQQWRANLLSRKGDNVIHVRLPFVADRMDKGATFAEAILEPAASGSGIDRDRLAAVLEFPDYLLADGLDECGASRESVSAGLSEWATGRSRTRIVVTTRPVGYDQALLPGWRHLELLPLDEEGVRQHAGNVLRELRGGAEEYGEVLEYELEEFLDRVRENETAKRAAGNPLLLGFLVGLFADGVPFGKRRAELYRRVVRRIRDQNPRRATDKIFKRSVVDRAAELLAWRLQHETVISGEEASEWLGCELEGKLHLDSLAAEERAEECIDFWEERGLLERLTEGSREALVFAHAGLGEYAAARYASRLGAGDLERWVTEVRRDARWREVLLLCAGVGAVQRVVGTLLALYDPTDPVGEELEIAALALAEAPELPVDLADEVADALRDRLTGDIPSVVFGAADSALGLAREAPMIVARTVDSLAESGNITTRLAAVRLLLECGPEYANLAYVERAMRELLEPDEDTRGVLPRGGFIRSGPESQIMLLGAKRLIQAQVEDDPDGLLGRSVMEPCMGWMAHLLLIAHLEDEGYEEILTKARERFSYARPPIWVKRREDLVRDSKRKIEEARTFLGAVLDAAGGRGVAEALEDDEREALATLAYGMRFPELPYSSWLVLVRDEDPLAIRTVLKGGIAALELDPSRVASEAAAMLEDLNDVNPEKGDYIGILGTLPEVPVDPRWEHATEANLPADDLVRALRHPSFAVAVNAAELVANGGGGQEARQRLARLREEGVPRDAPDRTNEVLAYVVPHLWSNEEAIEMLLDLLGGGLTVDNYELLLAVADLPGAAENERAVAALVAGIRSESPRAAQTLAEEVLEVENPLARAAAPHLKEVLEHWTIRGTTCERHGGTIHDDRCPRCNNVPSSPRAELVGFLGETGLLELERLIELCNDPRGDVRRSAAKQAAATAAREGVLTALLRKIEDDELPLDVLRAALELPPDQLRLAKDALEGLLSSSSEFTRAQVVGALATPGWVDAAEAIALAKAALRDEKLVVRDRAVATLRILGEGTA
jgi:hypothetical protein